MPEGEVGNGGEVVNATARKDESAKGFHFGQRCEVAGAALGEVEGFELKFGEGAEVFGERCGENEGP